MDDFKFDAFGLDDSFEGSVAAVDVEFELLFKLWTAGALYCASFVPLSLLLHTYTHINECTNTRQYINSEKYPQSTHWVWKILTTLGKGNSNFTLASRSLGETPEGREGAGHEHTFDTLLPGYFKDADLPSVPEGAGRLMPLMMYRISSLGVRLEWTLQNKKQASWPFRNSVTRATDSDLPASLRAKQSRLLNESLPESPSC